MLSSFWVAEQY